MSPTPQEPVASTQGLGPGTPRGQPPHLPATVSYTWPRSNWRPSACEADVIATRPQVLLSAFCAPGPRRCVPPQMVSTPACVAGRSGPMDRDGGRAPRAPVRIPPATSSGDCGRRVVWAESAGSNSAGPVFGVAADSSVWAHTNQTVYQAYCVCPYHHGGAAPMACTPRRAPM